MKALKQQKSIKVQSKKFSNLYKNTVDAVVDKRNNMMNIGGSLPNSPRLDISGKLYGHFDTKQVKSIPMTAPNDQTPHATNVRKKIQKLQQLNLPVPKFGDQSQRVANATVS